MNNTENLHKVYHRNYKNIDELFDDLKDAIFDIKLENNRIIIHYNAETLEIEHANYGYYTYLNGKREHGECEDQDIYFYAVEFVHEQAKGLTELEIIDTRIIDVNNRGITYVDEFDREHFISYDVCASNGPTKSCVAERDITKHYIKFFTPEMPRKIVFAYPFAFKKGKRLLTGGKSKRFRALQKAITDSGYTTRDLS